MYASLFLLAALLALAQSATYEVDCEWYGVTPVSFYINVGDTVIWKSTNTSQSHWIVRVTANFSGTLFDNVPNSPMTIAPQLLHYSYTFTEADYANEDQGFFWADLLNPYTAVYGLVTMARPDDVILDFQVFENALNPADSNPPFATADALYPLNATIMAGQRVVFRDALEPYLTHQISAGDGRNHWAACLTTPWVHTYQFTRFSTYWSWKFDTVGRYSWNCLVHPHEFGFINVCESKRDRHGVLVPNPNKCGKWQRCQNSWRIGRQIEDDEENP